MSLRQLRAGGGRGGDEHGNGRSARDRPANTRSDDAASALLGGGPRTISDEEIAATIRLTLETMPTGAAVKAGVSMCMNILPDVVRSLDKDPQTYSSADLFPHIVVDNFLPQSAVDTLVDEFPDPRNSIWNERIKDPYQVTATQATMRRRFSIFDDRDLCRRSCLFCGRQCAE